MFFRGNWCYSSQEIFNILVRDIDDLSLVLSNRLAALVKEPLSIPYYNAYTVDMIARYFGVSESFVRMRFCSNPDVFKHDHDYLSTKEIYIIAARYKIDERGCNCLCVFSNRAMANIPYQEKEHIVFNDRALLKFAVLLSNESRTASFVRDSIDQQVWRNRSFERSRPWFSRLDTENTKGYSEEPDGRVHPLMLDVAERIVLREPNYRTKTYCPKSSRPGKPVCMLDKDGKIIQQWKSMKQAAHELNISHAEVKSICDSHSEVVGTKGDSTYRLSYA